MTTNGAPHETTAMTTTTNGPGIVSAPAPVEATRAFEPSGIADAYQLAKILVASRLLPKTVATPEAAFAIIATGRELGLTAMQSLRSIHVIEGKPTLSADLICALVKNRSEVCEYFRLVESTDKVATYETKRRGEPSPTTMSFSWEDAERAGVVSKDNWRKYPAAMLRARAITALARAVYPDLAMGLYDPDELAAPAPPTTPFVISREGDNVAHVDSVGVFAELCDRIDEASNVGELNRAATMAGKAHKSGALSDAQLDQIKVAVVAKRSIFGTPPAAPPSDPDGVS